MKTDYLFNGNRRWTRRVSLILSLAALGTTGQLGRALASQDLPFRATAFTRNTFLGPSACGFLFMNEGSGTATHLGLSGLSTSACFSDAIIETASFTAANGDQLFLEETITAYDPVTSLITSSYWVSGGTGRFQHATGAGVHLFYDTPGSEQLNTFEGTIQFRE